jgi:glycerophosphoryl diester phosphodiesterase
MASRRAFRVCGALLVGTFLLGDPAAASDVSASPGPACRADRIVASLREPRGGRVLVAAHRGAHLVAPENSIAAIEGAIAIGADVIEIDARVTADGVVVLMHDDEVARTTGGEGTISGQSWAVLSRLRLRDAQGRPTDQPIPTLAQALATVRGRAVVDLDLKADDRVEPILAEVAAAGVERRVLFYDSDPAVLKRVRERFPAALILPLANSAQEAKALPGQTGASLVHLRDDYASAVLSRDLDALGANGWINALGDIDGQLAQGDKTAAERLISTGIDVIQTDQPALMLDLLRQLHLRSAKDEGQQSLPCD